MFILFNFHLTEGSSNFIIFYVLLHNNCFYSKIHVFCRTCYNGSLIITIRDHSMRYDKVDRKLNSVDRFIPINHLVDLLIRSVLHFNGLHASLYVKF